MKIRFHEIKSLFIVGIFMLMCLANFSFAQPSISLEVTVGTDVSPGVCAMNDSVTVDPGTDVNFCYKVTNTGTVAFDTHSLTTNAFGAQFIGLSLNLNPNASVFTNGLHNATSLVDLSATWVASNGASTTTVLTSDDAGGPVYNFTDISASGTALGLGLDGEAGVTMDFPFSMLDLTSADVTIGNNGAIILGDLNGLVSFSNKDLTATFPNNTYNYIIAPFWDDFSAESGDVYYETQGVDPNRIFIVQWEQRPRNSNIGAASFQIKLFETSNEIQFHYEDVQFENASFDFGASATVGITATTPAESVQFSFNAASLADAFAISFKPPTDVAESTNTAMVFVNAPDISLTQSSIDFSLDPDANATQDLLIDNFGSFILNWSLEEAGTRNFVRLANMPKIKSPDMTASADRAPLFFTESNRNIPTNLALLGSDTTAYALRIFPDDPQTLTLLDVNAATLLNDINTSSDYDGIFTADFVEGDYSTLYALRNEPSMQLVKINTATGTVTVVGAASAIGLEFWSGMTWDATTGNVYAVSTGGANSTLFSINITTGVTAVIGTIGVPLVIDIAADVDGNLYGVSVATDELIGIHKTTGNGTSIGPTNFDSVFAQGMDFDLATNTLYWATCTADFENDCGGLRTINLATGNSTLVGQIGDNGSEYTALAIANDITCNTDITWLDLGVASGSTASGATSNIAVNVDATGLVHGDYQANLCIRSDDADQPIRIMPINLNVSDVIFTNGFE